MFAQWAAVSHTSGRGALEEAAGEVAGVRGALGRRRLGLGGGVSIVPW